MQRTLILDTVTPSNSAFQIETIEDPSGIDVIVTRGINSEDPADISNVVCSEQEAVQAAVVLLYRYAPDALERWVVDGLDEGDEIEVQSRKGGLIEVPSQPKPQFEEL